jgi:hypothetical protein
MLRSLVSNTTSSVSARMRTVKCTRPVRAWAAKSTARRSMSMCVVRAAA